MRKLLLGLIGLLFAVPAVAATLPAGYTELEYINTNGGYLDLNYVFTTNNQKKVIKFKNITAASGASAPYAICGTQDGSKRSAYLALKASEKIGLGVGSQGSGSSPMEIDNPSVPVTVVIETKSDNSLVFNGGSSSYDTTWSGDIQTGHSEFLGKLNIPSGVYSGNVDVYEYSLYADGNIVREMIPVRRNSDNEIGMYDTVSGQFFTNQGTGDFVAGPEVLNPCRNLLNPATVVPGYVYTDGEFHASDQYKCSDYIRVYKDQTYVKSNIGGQSIAFYDINKTFQQRETATTFTASYDGYVRINMNANDTNMQFEQGSTATAYVPYCANAIKIATTAYNSARFSPVVTELNDTIATIRSVVTNTINQTKAIADLQATKQTRPDETCPAGKKCLLVEDDAGQPHWYEIIENASRLPDGFTELQYIESTGTQYIDTGLKADLNTKAEIVMRITEYSNDMYGYYFGTRSAQTNKSFILGTTDGKVIQGTSKFFTQFDTTSRYPVNNVEYIDLNKHTFELSKDGFYQDGGLKRTFDNPTDFTTDRNVVFFGADDPVATGRFAYSKVAVYSFKMWESGEMVRDFVPARRNSDGVIGMYDTVSGTFFTNAGSGTFTAGPEI